MLLITGLLIKKYVYLIYAFYEALQVARLFLRFSTSYRFAREVHLEIVQGQFLFAVVEELLVVWELYELDQVPSS